MRKGGMNEEEKKRKLAQASTVTAISTKAWGEWQAGERRLMLVDALQREKRGREDKGKEGEEKVKNTM